MTITRDRAIKLLWFFGAFVVVVFIFQYTVGTVPPLLQAFFEIIKVFLVWAIGFVTKLILASEDFQQELQRFVISAYRRISDIRYSMHRIREDITNLRKSYPRDKVHEFDVISARAEEIERHVISSEDDWKDFLQREISALDEIERRKDQIRGIITSTSAQNQQDTEELISQLRNEIRHLADSLPFSLKTLIDIEREEALPREGRHSALVADYINNSIRENSFFRIPVDARGVLTDLSVDSIKSNNPYGYYIDVAAGSEYFVMVGNDGREVGLVDNPFPSIYDKDYYYTLREFLPTSEELERVVLGGPVSSLVIPGSEFDQLIPGSHTHFYIKVPVPVIN